MSYNDGWRVYEDISVNAEKINLLYAMKSGLEKQLKKQQEKVNKVSEATRRLDIYNSTRKRRAAANMRLSNECNQRDTLQTRIGIIEDWIKNIKLEVKEM
jgi:hypothetical protein